MAAPALQRVGPRDAQVWGASAPLRDAEQRNLDTMNVVEACWNRRDVAAILSNYDEQITWRNVAMGETYVGKGQVGAFLTDLFAAVPDLTMNITMRIPRGDFVAEEYTIEGTHRGTLFGIPATGRRLRLQAVSFVQMRDGRLREDHFYFDATSILRQLGLFPALTVAQTPIGHALMGVAVFLRSPLRWVRTRKSVASPTSSS